MKKVLLVLSVILLVCLCSCTDEPPKKTLTLTIENNSGSDVYYQRWSDALELVKDGRTASIELWDGSHLYNFYRVDSYISTVINGYPNTMPVLDPKVSETITMNNAPHTVELTYSSTLQVNVI